MSHRIAMWSGPRNISTALLRSFENRPDTVVCDEPLYAFYLDRTGLEHPGRDEILASQPTDWQRVAAELTGPLPAGASVYYQKHMAHHLLPEVDRQWLSGFRHAFLIRDPREMLLSLSKVLPNPRVEDTGLPQQLELFRAERERSASAPPVLDAKDVLENPEGMLRRLCEALELDFRAEMLSWPAGTRDTDGVWAPHWYASVERSTGFSRWTPREGELTSALEDVLEACEASYRTLFDNRLRA